MWTLHEQTILINSLSQRLCQLCAHFFNLLLNTNSEKLFELSFISWQAETFQWENLFRINDPLSNLFHTRCLVFLKEQTISMRHGWRLVHVFTKRFVCVFENSSLGTSASKVEMFTYQTSFLIYRYVPPNEECFRFLVGFAWR